MIRWKTAIAAASLVLLSVIVACGSSPNEHVQSNEFFRPAAEGQQQSAAADADQDQQSQSEARTRDGQTEQTEQSGSDQQQSRQDADQTDSSENQQQSADDQSQPEQDDSRQTEDDDAPIETSDDIIRRYSNPSYGYSFELICSPFCDANSNGVDRVSFLSETGRALIGVDVHLDDGSDSDALLRSTLGLTDTVEFTAREETTTVTGEPAERFDWDEDRRATGGFQVRWHALLVPIEDIVIVFRAGAVLEDYEDVAPALERALGSFILPLEITARPGRYERFDFVIAYDTEDVSQEFGQPTSNPPSDEAGIFVLQSSTALKAVLTWQVLGEAFYDGDTAIQQSLSDSLGIESVTGLADWGEVDGQAARTGETETQFGEGVMKIRSFAWYCREGGREFALHVLDQDDPESVALPLIESFRCDADSAESADEDE
ncbi:MAG: hypothetical protein OXD50_04340 [Chloroflexi bacterium]|nr:hypothetical protein [Chloroflexota bacterium]